MVNKKGSITVQILIVLIVIVFTSATVLFLLKMGVISSQGEEAELLDTSFIPVDGRGGYLALQEFDFCSVADINFNCFEEKDSFLAGDDVYVRFLVESSNSKGQIMLVRNYEIIDPEGEVILELDHKNDYHFEAKTNKERENVAFADFFATEDDFMEGEYTLKAIIENPLIDKKITVSKKFWLFKVLPSFEPTEEETEEIIALIMEEEER